MYLPREIARLAGTALCCKGGKAFPPRMSKEQAAYLPKKKGLIQKLVDRVVGLGIMNAGVRRAPSSIS